MNEGGAGAVDAIGGSQYPPIGVGKRCASLFAIHNMLGRRVVISAWLAVPAATNAMSKATHPATSRTEGDHRFVDSAFDALGPIPTPRRAPAITSGAGAVGLRRMRHGEAPASFRPTAAATAARVNSRVAWRPTSGANAG